MNIGIISNNLSIITEQQLQESAAATIQNESENNKTITTIVEC